MGSTDALQAPAVHRSTAKKLFAITSAKQNNKALCHYLSKAKQQAVTCSRAQLHQRMWRQKEEERQKEAESVQKLRSQMGKQQQEAYLHLQAQNACTLYLPYHSCHVLPRRTIQTSSTSTSTTIQFLISNLPVLSASVTSAKDAAHTHYKRERHPFSMESLSPEGMHNIQSQPDKQQQIRKNTSIQPTLSPTYHLKQLYLNENQVRSTNKAQTSAAIADGSGDKLQIHCCLRDEPDKHCCLMQAQLQASDGLGNIQAHRGLQQALIPCEEQAVLRKGWTRKLCREDRWCDNIYFNFNFLVTPSPSALQHGQRRMREGTAQKCYASRSSRRTAVSKTLYIVQLQEGDKDLQNTDSPETLHSKKNKNHRPGFADNGLELNAASLPAAFEEIRLLPANYEKLKSSINPNSHLTKSSLCISCDTLGKSFRFDITTAHFTDERGLCLEEVPEIQPICNWEILKCCVLHRNSISLQRFFSAPCKDNIQGSHKPAEPGKKDSKATEKHEDM
ncbi:hypothetical protein Anapl_11633 [Anas platyrhynchos]|uniref:Uncharacterized protein n=1 Tax=Anas platyrhynchos TaxID=8839 RepID=R0KXE2_ANAPL|nr:hypothetical protein Anapl_11633 [Anas platyrhynchos]